MHLGEWDVIIVGARCAGAALAAFLGRAGVRTLLLDADPLPSDMIMTTHFIQPPGMDILDELGVGQAVRAVAPASLRTLLQCDQHRFVSHYPAGRPGYCVRRIVSDSLLQEASVRAGAELRDRHRVVALVRDRERVTGVVAETPTGRVTHRAELVVGADGRDSTIARLTRVEQYQCFEMSRGGYWFYFPMTADWRNGVRTFDSFIGWEGDGLRYVFQCDGELLLLIAAPPNAIARGFGQDYREKTLAYFRASEVTRPLVDGNSPVSKGAGLLKATFFYRRPVGPGFALVGDAGHYKDFMTAQGMTDAFISAKALASAIVDGSNRAFERYWRLRDLETMPLYFDAIRAGSVDFNGPFTRLLFSYAEQNQKFADRMTLVSDRQISPFDLVSTPLLLRMLAGDLVRGRADAVVDFVRSGRQIRHQRKEWAHRVALAAPFLS